MFFTLCAFSFQFCAFHFSLYAFRFALFTLRFYVSKQACKPNSVSPRRSFSKGGYNDHLSRMNIAIHLKRLPRAFFKKARGADLHQAGFSAIYVAIE